MCSQSRAGRFKSQKYVEVSDVEMDGMDGIGKGKGKGKQVEVDDGMVLDEQSSSQPPDTMNINEKVDLGSGQSRCAAPGTIRIKPLSSTSNGLVLPPTSNEGPITPAAGPCEWCFQLKRMCQVELKGHACLTCKSKKIKCDLVQEGWRSFGKHSKTGEGSTSVAKKMKRATTPHVEQATLEKVQRVNTPKLDWAKMLNVKEATLSTTQSKSCAQSVAPAPEHLTSALPVPPLTIQSQPGSIPDDLGQVPSKYIYLVSWEGKNVSAGFWFQTLEDLVPNDEWDTKIKQLERKNVAVEEKNVEIEKTVIWIMDEIPTLKNTIAMLVTSHNGHSAMLEGHQLLLAGPIAPSMLESQNGKIALSPILPGPPTTTPDPVLANTGLVPQPPSPTDPEIWNNLLNLGHYGLAMEIDNQSEVSSHIWDLEEMGEHSGGP
jgi:hypothetical protein